MTSDPFLYLLNQAFWETMRDASERIKRDETVYDIPAHEIDALSRVIFNPTYPNGCPILPEGPQKDDL